MSKNKLNICFVKSVGGFGKFYRFAKIFFKAEKVSYNNGVYTILEENAS